MINRAAIELFPTAKFKTNSPFPWHPFNGFLTAEAFLMLCRTFPPLDLFEKHSGLVRNYGQRPHNRLYLAYEKSIYQNLFHSRRGVIKHKHLPQSWQRFIEELESRDYKEFVGALLGVSKFKIRYCWHIGVTGCEVSPHVDAVQKIGTHLFYFNTSDDWDPDWGGGTLILGGKRTVTMNPEFTDFAMVEEVSLFDNRSLLFKNTLDAWHGMKLLKCPEGKYRRLFNVIFEYHN